MTKKAGSSKKRVMIYGSCVSRDVLRIDDGERLELAGYLARSSFGSGFADRRVNLDKIDTSKLASKFQRRMVEFDLNKRAKDILNAVVYDILLVDFIDERFAILEDWNGAFCTGSNELFGCGVEVEDFLARYRTGTSEHFELWRAGWDAFIDDLSATSKLDRLLVNKVYWAKYTQDGNMLGVYHPDQVDAANTYLDRLYTHVENTLGRAFLIEPEQDKLVSDDNHKWGISPFHYVDEYYRSVISAIAENNLSRRLKMVEGRPPLAAVSNFPTSQLHLHSYNELHEQEQEGFVGVAGTEPWPMSLPIDWDANPYNHRNWQFRLASWRPMDVYIKDYLAHGTQANLRKTLAFALDWYGFFVKKDGVSEFQWHDMATGLRAARLAWLFHQVELDRLQLSSEESAELDNLATMHFDMLMRDEEIAMNNHGLFQIFGLEMLAMYWRDGERLQVARDFGGRKLKDIMTGSFTEEGVHKESSPEYHVFILRVLERSCRGSAFAREIRPVLARAEQVVPFLSMPDGRIPAFGDTDNDRMNDRRRRLRADWVETVAGQEVMLKDLTASGYALARSMPTVPLEQAWMLFVSGMAHAKTHKHADDLGFIYDHAGQPLFVDPGKFSYERTAMRKFIVSAQAHNTVSLEGRPIAGNEISFVGSELQKIEVVGDKITLGGEAVRPGLFTHRREFHLCPSRRLEIHDTVEKEVSNALLNRLNIAPGLDIARDRAAILIFLKDGTRVRVASRATVPIEIMHASTSPHVGWFSPKFGEVIECTTLQTVHQDDMVDAGWIIDFQDA